MLSTENFLKYWLVVFWHHLSWVIAYIPFRTIWNFEVENPPRELLKKPLIIVANHKSIYDPWFIGLTLPHNLYRKIAPTRYMASRNFNSAFLNAIYYIIILPFIYFPNGVLFLPPRNQNGKLSISDKMKTSIDAIRGKESVLIFAEGRVRRHGSIHEFKRGPAYLQRRTKAPILLVSVKFSSHWWLPWTERKITWGKEYVEVPEDIIKDEEKGPEWLRKKVEKLYEK